MESRRQLVIVADDLGIGPETTRGILDLAKLLSATVLLVNTEYAADAVEQWRHIDSPLELGWHPNLTLDEPIASAGAVRSLVDPDTGKFWPLGTFMWRAFTKRFDAGDIERELRAQYRRFIDLVGSPPPIVNAHQHVALFAPVGEILLKVLREQKPLPYVRRVQEPWSMLAKVPGARLKRAFLNRLGRTFARRQSGLGFPGNDWLAGVTDPKWVGDTEYFGNWLAKIPGQVFELCCHPGHDDPTLLGRDCERDGCQRRVDEFRMLSSSSFRQRIEEIGFTVSKTPSPGVRYSEPQGFSVANQ